MPLVLTKQRVERGIIVLEPDGYGELTAVEESGWIALARCPACRRMLRVLPCDVLAGKQFSLPLIEHAARQYSRGKRSLRQVVGSMLGDRTPDHSTLRGWTEGLGAFASGRPASQLSGDAPVSRLLTESASRLPQVTAISQAPHDVDPRRHRSLARGERLAAMAMLLAVATVVTGLASSQSLTVWRQMALAWPQVCDLAFRSSIRATPIPHVDPAPRRRSASAGPDAKEDPAAWSTRTRSPPGATSRSRR
jgi:hypothetical protein